MVNNSYINDKRLSKYSSRLSSHLCTVDFTKKGQLTRYKCPLCDEVFTMPGALKHHFQSHRREELTGPFHCSEEGCQFSTLHRLVYQEHLHSQHALTLVSCTFRSCTLAFCTRSEMEGHRRIHMPFHCPRCDFVTAHAKQLSTHGVEHDRPLAAPEGQGGNSQSALETSSGRPKRALKRNPAYVSSSQEDDEETQQHNIDNRAREEVQKDKAATNINENPSKGSVGSLVLLWHHIMAGMEHMYRTHICPECRRCFKMRSHLLEHLHLHFPDPSLQCPTCNHYFTSKSKLRIHMLRESGQKVHRCHLCDYASVERNSLHRHLASVHSNEVGGDIHPEVYPCPTCGQSFRQSQALNPQDMEAHYRTHLAFHCSQCDFSCSNKSLFRQHKLQGHAGDEELTCNFCPFATFNPVEFQQHVGHFHANEKIHRCHQCSFVTAHKRVLRRHMLMHSGEKPHKCNLCDFRCRDETYLSKHMLIHSDDKNHMCSECGYVTKWKHYLNVHMRKHAGDLRYQCDQCSYRCHRTDQLNSHKLRHQAKSLICECKYCPYQTCYRQALHNHENCKHTRTREFRCALCPYSTYSSTGLFIHKRKAHGYVPGDKKWQENYAEKERENSVDLLQGFYKMPAKNSAEGPIKNLQEKVAGSAVQNEHNLETVTGPKTTEMANKNSDIVQVVVDKGILACHNSTDNPEQCCTLVLTTIANTECTEMASMQGETPNSRDPTYRRPTDMAMEDCDDLNDSEERETPLTATRQPAEAAENNTQIAEVSSAACNSSAESLAQSADSEIRLKAMRKQDKDQAEALVLEGRVQMLVVQNEAGEASIYRCEHCSYVTRKQTSLRHHCRSLCLARWKRLKCQACGAQFKQKRGLDTHRLRKCPALQKNTRSFRSSRLVTIERHCSTCTRITPTKKAVRIVSSLEQDDDSNEEDENIKRGSEEDVVEIKVSNPSYSPKLSCPNCCLKPDEVQCEFCSFVAKSQKAMANHVLVHPKDKLSLLKKVKRSVLRCNHCPFTCKQERCMTQHHEGAKPHRCRFCPFSTTRRYRLYAHESLHTGMGRHSCNVCDQTFGAASKLRQHHKRVHDKQPSHFCTLCDFSSYSLNDVGRHTLRCHTGKLLHPCSQCEARFSSDTALKQHCSRKHLSPASLDCATCQETFPTREGLEEHQRTHLTQQCPLCHFATRKRQPLIQHLLDEHEDGPPEDKPLKCAICGFACRHQLVFEQHVRSHGGTRLYKCTDCQYSTRNKQKITWHIRIHTGEKPYHCEQCSYSCVDPSRLKYHMRIHQEEKKYLCPECGYKCKWMSQLKYHMTKHTGDKPYACEECEYRTNRGDALRIHRETQHCDARTFICEKCGKGFKTRFLLKTHQRKHSEERPYVCGLCRRAFRWPAGLRHHYLTHTNQQPFMCRYCPYRAKQKFQVVKHLRGHHPDQPVEQGVAKDPHALSLTLQDARLGGLEEGAGEEMFSKQQVFHFSLFLELYAHAYITV
ncbi:unnamed protein product [Oncorhynchus mykiss]|uniref:C2H2-type domain-containing protein n=1 Tax=Oncorhynchus mykiss TaxID=8022 RepID=A0A060VSN6_ONCMY|nr:unnamed protein product [Oncorhynchus mykiss]